jgi:hypothetical protein
MDRFQAKNEKGDEDSSDSEDKTHVRMMTYSVGKVEQEVLTAEEASWVINEADKVMRGL